MPYPSALKGNPKCIFFTDFDGTITLQDSNDTLTDNLGFGSERRKQLNADTLCGRATFRETFQEMLDSIKTPFPECVQYLCEKITLDPYFKDFYHWAKDNGVPIIVLSSGMTPIIRALLSKLVGPETDQIEIICNEVVDRPGMTKDQEGGWTIEFHDESGYGHDKSRAIRPYTKHFADRPNEPRPTMFYAGDGVSDLSAARETDLLFAKKGRDLVTYCEQEGIPFTVFEDWKSILATTKEIFDGITTTTEVAAQAVEDLRYGGKEVRVTA